LDILTWIMGKGRGSRLYTKLVDQLGCVVDIDAYLYDMFEQSVLFIAFETVENVSFETIEQYVFEELAALAREGVTEQELDRAISQARREYLLISENTT